MTLCNVYKGLESIYLHYRALKDELCHPTGENVNYMLNTFKKKLKKL